MRNGILLVALAFAITMAIIVGERLSNEAMAVVVGALCGASASVPVSLALFIAASRNWGHGGNFNQPAAPPPTHASAPQPQVIVIAPPQGMPPNYSYAGQHYYMPPAGNQIELSPREFKIVGEE